MAEGGGQQYYGATAKRDEVVVKRVAEMLALQMGDRVEVVTGGMPGIPDDFASAWTAAGGSRVLCVVSSEHEPAYSRAQSSLCLHGGWGDANSKKAGSHQA